MNLATLDDLLTPTGQAALAEATVLAVDDSVYLSACKRLSKRYPDLLARAVVETALLRRRATSKFALAERMYFTREALEQASSEPLARYHAQRLAECGLVADLCCGIGGDAVALATRGEIIAVDCDALHLKMCQRNLAAHGLADRATLLEGNILTMHLPEITGAFIDPDRRLDGKRQLSVERCQPPLSAILERFEEDFPLGVKLAPGLDRRELENHPGEIEFISYEGELREAVLWRGSLAKLRHRATMLPGGESVESERPVVSAVDDRGEYIYEPDPAVIRADLVGLLASQLDAWAIEDGLALLSGSTLRATPFARRYALEATLPGRPRPVKEYLRAHGIGRVQVRRHGIEIDVAAFERQIRVLGNHFRTILLTRASGRMVALVLAATMSE